MKNIVLTGFMGTGKTVVSKILALRLRRQRLCIDDMIEWKVGKPISRIFAEDGEAHFRRIESEVIAAVSKDRDAVIDTGGGVVINEQNVRCLKEHGILFCLNARPEIILERTKSYVHRPLLNTEDPLEKIKSLLQGRSEYYNRADHTIDTSDITAEEVADKIIKILEADTSDKQKNG